MLVRAWLLLGVICAALQMFGFFVVLLHAGWRPGDPDRPWRVRCIGPTWEATTMTFLGMIAGQIGTAFAARTDRASLRSVGVFRDGLLLWGVAFELALAAIFIYVPFFPGHAGNGVAHRGSISDRAALPLHRLGRGRLRRLVITAVPSTAAAQRATETLP